MTHSDCTDDTLHATARREYPLVFLGHGSLELSYQFTEEFGPEWLPYCGMDSVSSRFYLLSFPRRVNVGHPLLALVRLDNFKVQPTAQNKYQYSKAKEHLICS